MIRLDQKLVGSVLGWDWASIQVLYKIQSVVFVYSCWQTNQPTSHGEGNKQQFKVHWLTKQATYKIRKFVK